MTKESLKEKSDIIVSKRKFGVEFEIGNDGESDLNSLRAKMGRKFKDKNDGSILAPNGREIVSVPMKGVDGARSVVKACRAMKEMNYHGDHITCGMHIHVDGTEFKNKNKKAVVDNDGLIPLAKENTISEARFFNDDLVKELLQKDKLASKDYIQVLDYLHNMHQGCAFGNDRAVYSKDEVLSENGTRAPYVLNANLDKNDIDILAALKNKKMNAIRAAVKGGSATEIKIASDKLTNEKENFRLKVDQLITKKEGKFVVMLQDSRPRERLRALFAFYLVFEDVIMGMTSPSRKSKNAFCQRLTESYSLKSLMKVKSYKDIQALWYKKDDKKAIDRESGNHYSDSRYYYVNLHSLWDNRLGTFEVRCHGGTVDEDQTLLWLALHQHIVDAIAEGKIEAEEIASQDDLKVEDKVLYLIKKLELPDYLQEYIIRMLDHFSGIKVTIKKD